MGKMPRISVSENGSSLDHFGILIEDTLGKWKQTDVSAGPRYSSADRNPCRNSAARLILGYVSAVALFEEIIFLFSRS